MGQGLRERRPNSTEQSESGLREKRCNNTEQCHEAELTSLRKEAKYPTTREIKHVYSLENLQVLNTAEKVADLLIY